MLKRYISRTVLLFLLTVAGTLLFGSPAMAQAPAQIDLQATFTSNDPSKLTIRLKNVSESACQVATTAQGTIAITKVMQGGKVLEPAALDASLSEDIGYLLKSQPRTLNPGEYIEIPLQVYTLKSGPILRSTTWSHDAGVFNQQYSIQAGQPLYMELSYSLPIMPESGAPACGTVFATTIGGMQWITPLTLLTTGIALAVITIIIWLIWRIRRRRHKTPVAAAAMVAAIGVASLFFGPAPKVSAGVVVPPDMQAQFDSCTSTFQANRDITGPGLDVLNDPRNNVEIVRTARGSDMTARRNSEGGLDITIYWNPDDRHPYAGTGGNADMCSPLYHEIYHAVDITNGTFSRDDCGGVEAKEVAATRAQNALRVRLGMPARSHYGEIPLPNADCSRPSNPARCTGMHCAETNGDPHLRTFDGLRYDFQAAGEFIAARNKSGSYEIQVRQEPWETSRIVSLNTSVAAKIGSDTIEIRAGTPLTLVVNGKGQKLEAQNLPGGGSLNLESGVVIMTWPDQSKAYVRSVGNFGIAISLQPSQALAGELEGLFGDANGNSNNDLRARGSDKDIKPTHEELYPVFANSWRIDDTSSLFTYDSGRNTQSYTDRSLPDKAPDPKTLPGYAAALAFCKSRGITDEVALANCALDVAITGRPEFARAAMHSQAFAAGADYGGTTWQLVVKTPGETPSVTFDAVANEKIFVDVPISTLPNQCGMLDLVGPNGSVISSGCIINGAGEIDGIVLPAAGTYTIKLAPSNNATGSATVRLLRITDQNGAITPDGQHVTATINKPGVVSYYAFNAQTGQRVYVNITGSTLVNQCGNVHIIKPNGSELASGCIINGKGEINTVVLPEDGQYKISVNPSSTATGTAQLRLILPTAEIKSIAMDGPMLETNLTKPGSIAQFTFEGNAGQRIFIDVPSSELPSQCGVLDLKGPDGGVVASGCIINRQGNLTTDGFVLRATGRHTIVLDPSENAVGKTSIRLRSR